MPTFGTFCDQFTTFAIVKLHGRQYKVTEGETIKAQFIEAEEGTVLPFSEVLILNDGSNLKVGAPIVPNAKVTTKVVSHGREDKILVFKYLRKNKSKKMQGHRQPFTLLSVTGIEG